MADFSRSDRVGAQIRRDISVLVHQAVRDGGLPSVSVSDVEINRELEVATVYVTALIGDEGPTAVVELNNLAKEFRRSLARSMSMRRVPEIRFRYDDSVDRGERIEKLLRDN